MLQYQIPKNLFLVRQPSSGLSEILGRCRVSLEIRLQFSTDPINRVFTLALKHG